MIEQYKNQVASLAKELGCELRPAANPLSAMMYVEFGYVEIPEIVDQITYLTALHEIAHFHNNDFQSRPPTTRKDYFDKGVLHAEAAAWNWALDKAIDEPTDASRRFMWDVCLGSYYTHSLLLDGKPTRLMNGNRHHIKFVYDKADEYFTNTVRRIRGDCKDFRIPYGDI